MIVQPKDVDFLVYQNLDIVRGVNENNSYVSVKCVSNLIGLIGINNVPFVFIWNSNNLTLQVNEVLYKFDIHGMNKWIKKDRFGDENPIYDLDNHIIRIPVTKIPLKDSKYWRSPIKFAFDGNLPSLTLIYDGNDMIVNGKEKINCSCFFTDSQMLLQSCFSLNN